MKELKIKFKYELKDIIEFIITFKELNDQKELYCMDEYDLYLENGEENISPNLICYISSEGIDIDDNDNEIYPQFVIDKGLEYFCSGQLLEDVVDNAIHQSKNINTEKLTIKQLVISLNYYIEKDNFLVLPKC